MPDDADTQPTDQPIQSQTEQDAPTESPYRLSTREWKYSIKRCLAEIKQDRITLLSAGVAFYWFLAVFPGIIAAVGLLGLVNARSGGVASINDVIRSSLPPDAAVVLVEAVRDAGRASERASLTAAVGGVLLALWGASAGMVALQSGLDVAYDVPSERRFFKKRLYAVILLAVATVLGAGAAWAALFGGPFGNFIAERVAAGEAIRPIWNVARWAFALFCLTGLIATFYYVGPNRKSPAWKWITPGGIAATVMLIAASLLFSLYASRFGSYADTYGPLAGVVVLVLWLYLSSLAILGGAELNAELERQSAKRSHGLSQQGTPVRSDQAADSPGESAVVV